MSATKVNNSGNNWQDKITSKIRDCINTALLRDGSENSYTIDKQGGDNVIGDTDTDSAGWHTPCTDFLESPKASSNYEVLPSITSPPGARVYRAIYPYKAASADELSLEIGDIVVLFRQETADRGWWLGEHQPTGRSGVFPANYVESLNRSCAKKNSSNHSSAEESRQITRPGRLTAIEAELAKLSAKLKQVPSTEQVSSLEVEVEQLKRVATIAMNSPVASQVASPKTCQDTPILAMQKKQPTIPVEAFKEVTDRVKTSGKVTVPSCFANSPKTNAVLKTSSDPSGQAERNVTPIYSELPSSKTAAAFKPAGYASSLATLPGRSSVSPASMHLTAVRVTAVTPSTTPVNVSGVLSPDNNNNVTNSNLKREGDYFTNDSVKAGIVAAGKLKRRSIHHYTKKCQRNFSKLCNFYETYAEAKRLGQMPEKNECSSTSPSSFATTLGSAGDETSSNNGFVDKSGGDGHNKSVDNPFHNQSLDSTAAANKHHENRFPVYIKNSPKKARNYFGKEDFEEVGEKKLPTVSSVLLSKKNKDNGQVFNKAATVATSMASHHSKDVRRPPMRSENNYNSNNNKRVKANLLSTPQPAKSAKPNIEIRCSSATTTEVKLLDSDARRESVENLRKRFEGITVNGRVATTNSIDCQPQEKKLRQINGAASTTPTTRNSRKFRQLQSPLVAADSGGKDSGLGNYGAGSCTSLAAARSGDSLTSSNVDLFNNAQTSQAFVSLEDSSSMSTAFSSSSNMNLAETKGEKASLKLNDGDRSFSATVLNQAGIFDIFDDCSLTWTESGSECCGDHHRTDSKSAECNGSAVKV